jgi:hypothetical protein
LGVNALPVRRDRGVPVNHRVIMAYILQQKRPIVSVAWSRCFFVKPPPHFKIDLCDG